MSPSMIMFAAGGVVLIVALIGLLVFLRRRDAAKGQDKQREGELVQELAAIAASDDAPAAEAVAPTPEAAAAIQAAAEAETPASAVVDPAADAAASLSLTSAPAPVAVPVATGDVPVPDATAPVTESSETVEPEATTPEPADLPAPDFEAPAFEAPPVAEAPAPVPAAEPAAVETTAPVVTLMTPANTVTTKAAADVAARLRAMAEAVEREARSSDDGFRVFDVVLDGFANLPVGTLLPEDEAVSAHSAFAAPSAVTSLQ